MGRVERFIKVFGSFQKRILDIFKYIESRYLNFPFDIPTKLFVKSDFISNLAQKNIESLDIKPKNALIPSSLIELLYPNFRLKYWFGKTTSKLNQFCYALVPFAEPYFYYYSYLLPIQFKIGGKFESALLRNIDPKIAKYNSQYGFNFYDGPNLKHIMSDWAKVYTPIAIRPLLRSVKSKNYSGLQKLQENSEFIFSKPFIIDEYIQRDKVTNVNMYSRILTLEYFIRNFM